MTAPDPVLDWSDVEDGDFSTTEIIYVDPETRARRWKTYLAVHTARAADAVEQPIPLPRDGQPPTGLWQDGDQAPVQLFTDEEELADLGAEST